MALCSLESCCSLLERADHAEAFGEARLKYTIQAPSSFSACETEFLRQLLQTPLDAQLVIDMGPVTYLKPQDIMLLFLTTRGLALKTGYRVELINLFEDHLKYLERMDFFTLAAEWVFTRQPCVERWQRNPDSLSCQAIMQVKTPDDIALHAAPRVRAIAETWGEQTLTPDGVDAVVAVVAELCANAIEHGKQPGYVMIQRYQSRFAGTVDIHIAVGDMGQGIRQSLMRVYGSIGATDADYITYALNGKSARGEGNGGDGLRRVRRITRPTGSWLRLRSGTGSVRLDGERASIETNQPFLVGTQAIVVLRADT